MHQKTKELCLSIGEHEKTFEFALDETVWAAKQLVLLEFASMDIKDPLNFGFYMPPYSGRAGKFLDEERCLREYPMDRSEPFLEFRYKRRIFRNLQVQDEKKLLKVNAKNKRRKFIDYILTNNLSGLEKLLEKGLDPNFQDDRTCETPLMIASTQPNCQDLMKLLVQHGAHLDFRGKDGLTAVHKATVAGRVDSLKSSLRVSCLVKHTRVKAISVMRLDGKCLLDLGSSPNYKDAKGLTPLYWCVLAGSNAYICELLLTEHADLGVCDLQGAQEIHQACKLGYAQHLEHLIFFGADVNARTGSGNTPLHICALDSQESCARVLLYRGADRSLTNFAQQTAYDVAVMAKNIEVGAFIKDFDQSLVKVITEVKARGGRRRELQNNRQNSLPPAGESSGAPANISLMRAASSAVDSEMVAALKKRKESAKNSSVSDHSGQDDNFSDSDSNSESEDEDKPKKYVRTFSNAGVGTKRSPAPLKINPSGAAAGTRNRLYTSVPGRQFVAVTDYEPQSSGDLDLTKGDVVEVLYVGEKGFWEGNAHGKTGWFPSYCVQEVKKNAKQGPRSWFSKRTSAQEVIDQAASREAPLARSVSLRRSDKGGYGFHLRGASSHLPHIDFTPSPQFPALQYIGEVEKGGVADRAGLMAGDFVLEINGENVVNATHVYAVSLISKAAAKSLDIKVITVAPETLAKDILLPNGTLRSKDVNDERDGRQKDDQANGLEGLGGKSPLLVTPTSAKKAAAPPPPTRASSTVLSLANQSSGQEDIIPETQGGIAAEPETVILGMRDERRDSTKSNKSMWADNAYKLQGSEVEIREDNIASGMGRKQKALSYDLASEFEKKFQEITKQVTVNASEHPAPPLSSSSAPQATAPSLTEEGTIVLTGGINKLEVYEKRMSRSGSSSSSLGSGSGSPGTRRPRVTGPQRQTPPPYEYSIESLRRRRVSEENQIVMVQEPRNVPLDFNMRPRSVAYPPRPSMHEADARADFVRRSPRFAHQYPPPAQLQYNPRTMLGHATPNGYANHDQLMGAYNHRSSLDEQHFATLRSHNQPAGYGGQPMHPPQFGGTLPSRQRPQGAANISQAELMRDFYRHPSPAEVRLSNGFEHQYADASHARELSHNQQNYRLMQEVSPSPTSAHNAPQVNRDKKPTPPHQVDGHFIVSQGRLQQTEVSSHPSRNSIGANYGPPPAPVPDYDMEPGDRVAVPARTDQIILSLSLKPAEPSSGKAASNTAAPPAPPLPPVNSLESSIANAVAARNARMKSSQFESGNIQAGKTTSPSSTVNRRQQHPAVDVFNDSSETDIGEASLQRRDSATGSECSNLYNSSSNASLDSQCSKDSGFDQSENDHSSLLAQAVAKQREKLAKRESVVLVKQEVADVSAISVFEDTPSLKPSDISKASANALRSRANSSEQKTNSLPRAGGDTAKAMSTVPVALQASAPPAVKQKPRGGPTKSTSSTGSESTRKSESDPSWPVTITSEDAATIFLDDVIADAEASIDYDLISVGNRGSSSPAGKQRLGSLTFRSGEERGKSHTHVEPASSSKDASFGNSGAVSEAFLPPPPDELVADLNANQNTMQRGGVQKSAEAPPSHPTTKISLSSDKLPVQLSVKSFVEWSVEDVCVWLDHLQLGQYKKTFIENDIQGKHLPDLSKEELKELGVTKLGHRMTLDDEIAKMTKNISEI